MHAGQMGTACSVALPQSHCSWVPSCDTPASGRTKSTRFALHTLSNTATSLPRQKVTGTLRLCVTGASAGQRQRGRTCGIRAWTARRCSCGAPSASGRCRRAASASGTVSEGVRMSGAPSRRLQERGGVWALAAAHTPAHAGHYAKLSPPARVEGNGLMAPACISIGRR